jgi:hypothetical protein
LLRLIQNAIDLRKLEQLTPNKADELKRSFELLIKEPSGLLTLAPKPEKWAET